MKNLLFPLFTFLLMTPQGHTQGWYDGAHGKSMIVEASTEVVQYNLNGQHGRNGSNGSDGARGSCDSYTDDSGNTQDDHRRGGDGENGDDGGKGGNGGNLTVLFENLDDLKNIFVTAKGGQGGDGGSGGDGGWGCPRGSDGYSGSRGANGKMGSLYLVPSKFHPYQEDSSNKLFSIKQLQDGQKLVKQIWSSSHGALALLEAGSVINDLYFTLINYEYGHARIDLVDEKLIDPKLLENQARVTLSDNVAQISFGPSHIALYTHSDPSEEAVLLLERLYRTSDFNSLSYKEIVGKPNDRQIILKTSTDLVPRPDLKLNLKVEIKGRFFKYHEVFKGDVAPELIHKIASGYMIELEKLPLVRPIPAKAKIRLSFEHQLTELSLASRKNTEVWVIRVK